MIRVLIADDHPVVRQGLKQIITETPGITVAGEANTGPEALDEIRSKEFDVVVLDLAMPGMSGLEVLKLIRIERPHLPVLMLSFYPEEQYAIRALRAGAAGYLTKASAPEECVAAIRRIAEGGKYITSTLAETLAVELQTPSMARMPHEMLSDREYQVLCLIAKGRTVREIADHLHLSPKTVSTYRTRILTKMRMQSNAELMRYALDQKLVE